MNDSLIVELILDWKQTRREKKHPELKQARLEKEREYRERLEVINNIILWPGNKESLEDHLGYKTNWIDTGTNNKGLFYADRSNNPLSYYNTDFQRSLLEQNLVALVNVNINRDFYYGIPVKKV
jgi:hypothetical protein